MTARPPRRGLMRWAIPLGRLAGVRVYLHASFFLLVVLVAAAESGRGRPGAAAGLGWLVILFACVLVHELAHSVVARRRGAEVQAIVLLPIGGVSRILNMPERWVDELVIAAVGPLTNLLIAALAGAVALATHGRLLPPTLTTGPLPARLAWTNLLLGGFNLLPAFPLDGGRVLRAALEERLDVEAATHTAARLARGLAGAMVVVGVLWDLWLAVIGVFVLLGASQEELATIAHQRLHGVPVARLMRRPAASLDAATQAAAVLAGPDPGPWAVTVAGRYVGLVDRAGLHAAGSAGRVGDVADSEVPVLAPGDDIGRHALDLLLPSGFEALPVAEGGAVVGMLHVADIEAWLRSTSTRA